MRIADRGRGWGEAQFISVRVSARLQFDVEMAARIQHRSQASYVEWAIENSLLHPANRLVTSGGKAITLQEIEAGGPDLWHVHEMDRLLNVAKILPEILTEQERALLDAIAETFAAMRPPRVFRDDLRDREFLRAHRDLFVKGAAHSVAPSNIAAALAGDKRRKVQINRLSDPGGPFARRVAKNSKKPQRSRTDVHGHGRTEFLAVSVPSRAFFRLQIASRMRRCTLPGYFEWALEDSLGRPENTVVRSDGSTVTLQELEATSQLWSSDEVDCFLNMALRIPEVMDQKERVLLQCIRETFEAMTPPRPFTGDRADRQLIRESKALLYTAADHHLAPSFIAGAMAGDEQAIAKIGALFEASYPIPKGRVRRPAGRVTPGNINPAE